MSQDQIVFENTCLQLATGDYRGYKPGSLGNVIHYLRGYGLHEYDSVQVGYTNSIGTVTHWGKEIATFEYSNGLPVFQFIDEYKWLSDCQDNYLQNRDKYPNPYSK